MSTEFDVDTCRTDIFEQGEFVVALDIPKVQANALCVALTEKNDSYDFDWQYTGGRVCVRQLKRKPEVKVAVAAKKDLPPKSVVNNLVDFAFSKMHEPNITTNFFRTFEDHPLVLLFYTQEGNEPRMYHAFWTEDGNSHGHVALGDAEARDRFVRNCYERDAVTTVPSNAYNSLTDLDHFDARDKAIEMLKVWE